MTGFFLPWNKSRNTERMGTKLHFPKRSRFLKGASPRVGIKPDVYTVVSGKWKLFCMEKNKKKS